MRPGIRRGGGVGFVVRVLASTTMLVVPGLLRGRAGSFLARPVAAFSASLRRADSAAPGRDVRRWAGRPPRGLSAEDFGEDDRSIYAMGNAMGFGGGYEEDVDAMAAAYVPEEDDYDDWDPEEAAKAAEALAAPPREDPVPATTTSTTTRNPPPSLFESTPIAPIAEGVPDYLTPPPPEEPVAAATKEEEEEPLSPLSFLSAIAEPTHLDTPPAWEQPPPPPPPPTTSAGGPDRSSGDDEKEDESDSESADDWRSKYAIADSELPAVTAPTMAEEATDDRGAPPPPSGEAVPPTESNRRDDKIFGLETELEGIEKELAERNGGEGFNPASPRQVSQVLYGRPSDPTGKAVLEGMAATNPVARLVLDHRRATQQLRKLRKAKDAGSSGGRPKPKLLPTPPASGDDDAPPDARDALLLVDTSSFIFRAYYSMPPMHRGDGMPVGAVLGFCNMLNRMVLGALLAGLRPRLVLCCDAPGKTFRHELYNDYKAQRPPAPVDLIPQFGLIREAARAYGAPWIEAPGYEADDVIATLARRGANEEGLVVKIYSGDKDLMQLVTDPTTNTNTGSIGMVDPMTMTEWDHDSVLEKWGVPSRTLGDLLALAGDKADNVPGVPGIGPKIAAKLLEEFGSLEGLLENLDQIPQAKRREKLEMHRDQARLSRDLVRLEQDLEWASMTIDNDDGDESAAPPPPSTRVAEFRMKPMDADRILEFYDAMGFVTIKERLLARLKRAGSSVSYSKGSSSPPPTGRAKPSPRSTASSSKTRIPQPEDYKDVPF